MPSERPEEDKTGAADQRDNREVPADVVREAPVEIDPEILARRAFREAPILAARVATGELPPVGERLPEHPLVIKPLREIGRYGGAIRRALTADVIEKPAISKTMSEDLLGFERPLPKSVQVNLAESYEIIGDDRVVIFHLRKGIRWSDGVPFTVDDILFWYDDMYMNDDARSVDLPVPSSFFYVAGKPLVLEKIDASTLRVSATRPIGRVREIFSQDIIAYSKHVFSPFHPRYNPDAEYSDFRRRTTEAQLFMNPDYPRLTAWVPAEWIRGQRLVYRRNPYYWKIDTVGNQLPYADTLEFTVIPDPQAILLKFINGEIDIFVRYTSIEMVPSLRAYEEKGVYELRVTGPERGPAYYLNWDAPNPALREAFRNRDVRLALSHAVNREEIGEICYHGYLVPSGFSYAPAHPYFSEEDYRIHTAFDPVLARRLLDGAGYRDSDGDGIREFPDGEPFALTIDVSPTFGGIPASELIAEHWKAVGIKVYLNIGLREIIWPRRLNGEFDVHFWPFEGPDDPLSTADDWAIVTPRSPFWHRRATEEGPAWLHEATECFNRTMMTLDEGEIRKNMVRARQLYSDNVPGIVVGSVYYVWGANRRLGNVPYKHTAASVMRGASRPIFHEQVYVRAANDGKLEGK
jgi:peptide/nickel transport system substrate-binding protein